jgi:uncharacterized protein YcnI
VRSRLVRRGAAGAVVSTLLLAAPAAAHPFFEPREVPADSLATVSLAMAHGCAAADADGDEAHDRAEEGDEEPTREVAVEVPEQVAYVEPAEADGWELDLETDDGRVAVILWSAEEGTDVPAPEFELDVVVAGESGDEVHWRVMQACDEGVYRWVGTPDQPAEDPAVTMALTDPDPDAPPPPRDDAQADEGEAGSTVDEPVEEQLAEDATDEPVEEEFPEDFEADDAADEALPSGILIAVLVVTLVIAGVVLSLRGRGEGGEDEGPDS